jgi:cytoskeleton protein RodZ
MVDPDTGIAARLRAARIEQGLGLEALARELKNPLSVLETIERGDWARLGAPVFARHLVGRYASRLGVAVDVDEIAAGLAAPELRSQLPASRIGRFADFSSRHAAYAGGTLLVVPLVFALLNMTANGPAQVRALDPAPVAAAPEVSLPAPTAAAPTTAATAADAPAPAIPGSASATGDLPAAESPTLLADAAASTVPPAPQGAAPTTVAASLAGGVGASSDHLELRFSGDSWIEVFGRDGSVVERVLARAGDARRFAIADVGRVTIGNVEATDVVLDGSSVNLDAVRAANVARFALSSDGSIEPVAR